MHTVWNRAYCSPKQSTTHIFFYLLSPPFLPFSSREDELQPSRHIHKYNNLLVAYFFRLQAAKCSRSLLGHYVRRNFVVHVATKIEKNMTRNKTVLLYLRVTKLKNNGK